MNETQQVSGMWERRIFGQRMFLPVDTALLEASAGLGTRPTLAIGHKQASIYYSVGFYLTLSHVNFPRRELKFTPIGGGYFEVEIPFVRGRQLDPDDAKAAGTLIKEELKMLGQALPKLGELLFNAYVQEGEVSLGRLKQSFHVMREEIWPQAPKIKSERRRRT